MQRREIDRRFDEIVAFAEIERFLDTPVKRYSSGMYVRLAFAVAAHLEPEILLVDEVLAVGDIAFQQKCIGKMGDVAKEGRTVLFISHQMMAIAALCNKTLLLSEGRREFMGPTADAIERYLASPSRDTGYWRRTAPMPDSHGIFLEEIAVTNSRGVLTSHIGSNEGFQITVLARAVGLHTGSQVNIRFTNHAGIPVFSTGSQDSRGYYADIHAGRYRYQVEIPANLLNPGRYRLLIATLKPEVKLHDKVEDEISVLIEDVGSLLTRMKDHRQGVINLCLPWTEELLPDGTIALPDQPADRL
jgi:lipopolysaccharide transport system ATP-binding protein